MLAQTCCNNPPPPTSPDASTDLDARQKRTADREAGKAEHEEKKRKAARSETTTGELETLIEKVRQQAAMLADAALKETEMKKEMEVLQGLLQVEVEQRHMSRLSLSWLRRSKDAVVRAHVGVSKLGLELILVILEECKAEESLESSLMNWRQQVILCLFMLKVDPGVRVVMSRFALASTGTVSRLWTRSLFVLQTCLKSAVGALPQDREPVEDRHRISQLGADTRFSHVVQVADCTLLSVETAHHHVLEDSQWYVCMYVCMYVCLCAQRHSNCTDTAT